MRFSETMLGATLFILGIAVTAYAWTLPAVPGQQYGAAAFPVLIGVGFVCCALVLLVQGYRAAGSTPLISLTEWTRQPGALVAVGVTILCIVAYMLLARRVGFVPVSVVILIVMFRMLSVSWGKAIFFAVVATLVTDYVFRSLLLVPLPFGMMPRLPW
ncbi:tripartite tricarboxylate transporter TctB family protein [Aliihoeflea sp. PC F10.4]